MESPAERMKRNLFLSHWNKLENQTEQTKEVAKLVLKMQQDLQTETRILEGTPLPKYKPYTDEEFQNELSSSQAKQRQ